MKSGYLYLFIFITIPFITYAEDERVNLTVDIPYIDIKHKNKIIRIERNQDTGNMIDLEYGLTSRPCPPYCIQPIKIAEGVETIGELELMDYLQQISKGNGRIMVIDSREEKWLQKGMIPGAVNIPWQQLYNKTTIPGNVEDILTLHFDVAMVDSLWNFQNAKTLVFYCNGPWCGQSPTNIRSLINLGYPAHKIKWYRGGMQSWKSFGLTTVQP